VPPTAPTDEQLDVLIRARLALAGVDLDQLPETPDPATGSPSRAQALTSLRTFLRTAVPTVSTWAPPASGPDADAYAQQAAPPLLYPSITQAWTGKVGR
jgi:hypothetical protein